MTKQLRVEESDVVRDCRRAGPPGIAPDQLVVARLEGGHEHPVERHHGKGQEEGYEYRPAEPAEPDHRRLTVRSMYASPSRYTGSRLSATAAPTPTAPSRSTIW